MSVYCVRPRLGLTLYLLTALFAPVVDVGGTSIRIELPLLIGILGVTALGAGRFGLAWPAAAKWLTGYWFVVVVATLLSVGVVGATTSWPDLYALARPPILLALFYTFFHAERDVRTLARLFVASSIPLSLMAILQGQGLLGLAPSHERSTQALVESPSTG